MKKQNEETSEINAIEFLLMDNTYKIQTLDNPRNIYFGKNFMQIKDNGYWYTYWQGRDYQSFKKIYKGAKTFD